MSGQGAPEAAPVDAAGLRLGIVATTWHAEITEALPTRPHPENVRYLRTKRDRMGHLLEDLDQIAAEGNA